MPTTQRRPPSIYHPDPTANTLLHHHLHHYNQDKHYTVGEQLSGIYYAVQWSEPLIIGLISIYTTLFIVTLVGRHHLYLQATVLLLCFLGVLCSESLNQYAATHWRSIVTQPYFDDPNGLFITLLWSIPLSLIALIAVINLLVDSSQLLIKVKVKQLSRQRQQRNRQQQAEQPDLRNGGSESHSTTLRQRHAAASRVGDLD